MFHSNLIMLLYNRFIYGRLQGLAALGNVHITIRLGMNVVLLSLTIAW